MTPHILLLLSVMETLQLWICRTSPFMGSSLDGVDVGVDQLKALDLGLGDS